MKAIPFKQIACSVHGLYAIDEQGGVWQYFPATDEGEWGKRYSSWLRLTERRQDHTGQKPEPRQKRFEEMTDAEKNQAEKDAPTY